MVHTKVIFMLKLLNNFWITPLTDKTVKTPKISIAFYQMSFEDDADHFSNFFFNYFKKEIINLNQS